MCWDWLHFISPLSVLAIFAQKEDREKISFPSDHPAGYLWISSKIPNLATTALGKFEKVFLWNLQACSDKI